MDTAQWPQEMMLKPMEDILIPINNRNTLFLNSSDNNGKGNSSTLEKKTSAPKAQAVNCPRYNSTNTKFCYYNNYSLSQPRYFCKACKRYWTVGGSFRNIPIGGVSRKNKKTSTNSSLSNSSKKLSSLVLPQTPNTYTTSTHENHKSKQCWRNQYLLEGEADIHDFRTISELIQVPNLENESLDLLNGVGSRRCGDNDNPYTSMLIHNDLGSMYSSGYSCLPTLGFSLDGIGDSGYQSLQGVEESGNSERGLFPFEDLKHVSSTHDHNMENNTGYWNRVLGGGTW